MVTRFAKGKFTDIALVHPSQSLNKIVVGAGLEID